jgi:hypothetical protein
MLHPRRTLGLVLSLAAFASPLLGQDRFAEGVDLWGQGKKAEALQVFQEILASDPTNEAAYEMWSSTNEEIWLDLLVEGGEYKAIAERLMERAELGRKARANDVDAIKALVREIRGTASVIDRRQLVNQLAVDHGEYAVPQLLPSLADAGDEDWRVVAMHTLTRMDSDVVLPLIEALQTDDAFLRRNVALVLGYIGDPRAAASLEAQAATDGDGMVVKVSKEAAGKCGSEGNALARFLRDGDDYYHRRATVLRPFDYSDVVWSWDGQTVTPSPVPRSIYNSELSKRAYYRALDLAADSLDARAGIARASADVQAKLAALEAAGEDVSELAEQAAVGALAVAAAGVDALDRALTWAVINDDQSSGTRLCATLGQIANAPTPGLLAALDGAENSLRGEAAVALANIAVQTGVAASPAVVAALGQNAGREVVRIAALIDGNTARAEAIMAGLSAEGIMVNHRGSGAQGLAMLRRIPGVDVILVGDSLAGLTADKVIATVSEDPVTGETPVFFVSDNEELADAYGDRIAGSIADPADLSALEDVFTQNLSGDRAQANDLAARSAAMIGHLGRAGHTNVSATIEALTSTLAHRPDEVVVPAMSALSVAGTANQAGALLGVLADDGRSEDARVAAADALAGILGRHSVSADVATGLRDVLGSDAPLAVRAATARALGRVALDAESRRDLLRGVRVNVTEG